MFLLGLIIMCSYFSKPVDGRRKGWPWNAEKDVHPSRLTVNGRAMDAESGLLPQTQADE